MSENTPQDPRPAAIPAQPTKVPGSGFPPNFAGAPKKQSNLGCLWALLAVVAVIVFGFFIGQSLGSRDGDSVTLPDGMESTASEPTKSQNQLADEAAIEQGWKVYSSGEVYFRFADPSEYTCGYTGCAYAAIVSRSGCAGGFYAKIDVLNEAGTPIGWSNQISASAQPNEPVQVRFDILEQGATNVRIAEINCLS